MIDREKVIEILELCTSDAPIDKCLDNRCPYFGGSDDRTCFDYLMKDALELLKAQEPRVLTVDEISALDDGTVVWVDFTDGRLLPMIVEGGCLHRWKYLWRICESAFHDDYYMARAWTSRPTDEQKEATPW